MSVIEAQRPGRVAPARPAAVAARQSPPRIRVEIADGHRLGQLRSDWTDLLPRAAPNVFMDPTLVRVAAELEPQRRIGALLAWKTFASGESLAGVLAFGVGRCRKAALAPRALLVPPCTIAYLGTPVIDRACPDEVLHAMLDAVAGDPRLPNILALDSVAMDGPTMEAMTRVCAARGAEVCVIEQWRRPMLISPLDGKRYLEQALSGSTRKKLRQHRRRLAEQGVLSFATISEPADLRRSLEQFLALEASGWKGRNGTALLCDEREAAFARAMIGALGGQGCASMHALCLDGRPVAMQIVLRSGPAAFTWKTAYDECFHDFSPGMLLLEDYTAAFLADASIAVVDSCAQDENGFMSVWTERQAVGDVWIDARRGGSRAFGVLSRLQKTYRRLRAIAKKHYLATWRRRR